jgi:DNA-binding beta-propeller fold protein YncE
VGFALRRALLGLAAALAAGAAACSPAGAASGDGFLGKFGNGGTGPGQFQRLSGVATDRRGYVYVADERDGRIQKFTADGRFVRVWGDPPEESDLYNDDNPLEIAGPRGLAVGPDGNVYVAESAGRTRISVWSPTGRLVRAFADRGEGEGQLSSPYGIAIDAQGSVYVADSGNNRIEKFSAQGQYAASIGKGAFTAADDALSDPKGVTIAPDGTLWAVDELYRRVQHYTAGGRYLGGFGQEGDGPGEFRAPAAITATAGALYVADRSSSRVQRFALDGTYVAQVGGTPGSGDGQFSHPQFIASDCAGSFYVSDSDNVRVQRLGAAGAKSCGNPDDDGSERLVLRFTAPARQSFGRLFAVRVTAGCDRPCFARVRGTVRVAGARRALKLRTLDKPLDGVKPAGFNLLASDRDTDRIVAALRHRRKVTVSLTAQVTDLRGTRVTARRSVRLAR